MNGKRLGSNFDDSLETEGLREAATAVAAKRVIASSSPVRWMPRG